MHISLELVWQATYLAVTTDSYMGLVVTPNMAKKDGHFPLNRPLVGLIDLAMLEHIYSTPVYFNEDPETSSG
ncbi:MAG: hypothetical protein ACI9NN_002187 [Bacteroidia bacterium]|jgi:hypothetical protein